MNYPNVSLDGVRNAIPNGADPGVVESATETLREIMGDQFPASQIRWDASSEGRHGILYRLGIKIPEWNVNHDSTFPGREIVDQSARSYRLRSVWGQLLKEYSHRLLKEYLRKGAEDAR